jgi:hypothetical protein
LDTERNWKAVAGGVLSIIAGFLHLFLWLSIAIILNKLIGSGYFGEDGPSISATTIWILILPLLILAVIAIIGGIFALKKKFWGLALAGSICAIFSPTTWMIGVTATVLVSISRHEFNRITTPNPSLK